MSQYNAKVAEQQARAEEQATQYRQMRQAEAARRYQGTLKSQMGASGAVMTEGAPLLIQQEQAIQSELDNLMLGYQGQLAARRSRSQGNLDMMQAESYGQRASNSMMAGRIGAGASLMSNAGNILYKYG
jgi:hypothetical protein